MQTKIHEVQLSLEYVLGPRDFAAFRNSGSPVRNTLLDKGTASRLKSMGLRRVDNHTMAQLIEAQPEALEDPQQTSAGVYTCASVTESFIDWVGLRPVAVACGDAPDSCRVLWRLDGTA